MSTRTQLSVIIPSYSSAGTLAKCLQSVVSQSTEFDYEVIVVHSGKQAIPDKVLSSFPTVQFQVFQEKLLPGKARNWALDRVSSAWVLFIDADCILDPNYIQVAMDYAQTHNIDGLGGGVKNANPSFLPGFIMHLLEFNEWLGGAKPRYANNFPSCNALYKRASLLSIGGFSEEVFPCEDTILNHKLIAANFSLVFFPKCGVKHIHKKNWRDVISYNRNHGITYGYAAEKYKLPGCTLLNVNKYLVIPVIVITRFVRVTSKLILNRRLEILGWLLCIPYVMVCLFAWAIGFVNWNSFLKEYIR